FSDFPEALPRGPRSTCYSPSVSHPDALIGQGQIEHYMVAARYYMRKGLARSTIKVYDFAWRTFALFCLSVSMPVQPVAMKTVCAFICNCTDVRHFKPPYIRSLLAGIQFHIRCSDPEFPSLFSHISVKLLLKGITQELPQIPNSRRPITLPILQQMVDTLRGGVFSPYSDTLLEAVFLLAFYAFLRCGEFTTSTNSFSPDTDLTAGDLTFYPTHYQLRLRHSKRGGACSVIVARTESDLCPFRAMLGYLRVKPTAGPTTPLFLTPGNAPLSRTWFRHHLNIVLTRSHLSPHHYSGHSFRIGAATSASNQGIPGTTLQQMGRWSSSAVTSYIRPDLTMILAKQRAL
uniref:Tyr recombinase domain-containing protein n=1 Tax=Gasterosteus aculeatus TaxID=69293 RepID=G3Q7Q9_GASAC